ncbi:MAG: hypothetical protein JWL77_729 [Chthonomonadaceae bacterium]|jgi:CcmD family protein|nr:hypothetical protein [Chthonomonadaceae bacterium]
MTLGLIMAVTLVTWGGVFAYLLMIDRSVRRLEHDDREEDDL